MKARIISKLKTEQPESFAFRIISGNAQFSDGKTCWFTWRPGLNSLEFKWWARRGSTTYLRTVEPSTHRYQALLEALHEHEIYWQHLD